MNAEKLEILMNRQGFIAALDQSGGSSKKTLTNYGIGENEYHSEEEMFALIHNMRSRIITSPVFTKEKILGVILFEKTMDSLINEKYTADYLWQEKGIVSFLKIDKGLASEENGVELLKDVPDLEKTLVRAQEKNIIGTKMRSVINEPNRIGIAELVHQQFSLAAKIATYNLIPIIEPEVDIYAVEKFGCEQILLDEIKKNLVNNNYPLIFKFTLPEQNNFYDELLTFPNVLKIVALSGGYERSKANALLKNNQNMIASFSRALLEGLNVGQSEKEFNNVLQTNIDSIYEASINK